MFDPEVGIDFPMLVHSGQAFRWERVVVAGEELTTTATVGDITERGGMGFYEFEIVTRDERDEPVATGHWRMLVRGREQS
jgi:acyl dehydratase